MSRIPRRLRSLNIPMQADESVQLDEENLEGPPAIDDLLPKKPPDSTSHIKIIWPNGDVRQIIGEFRGKNLSELRGGKVIVETDGNGLPNGKSAAILCQHLTWLAENSTFAPLHIPRWDNELFLQKHGQMITDVEEKFIYPNETKQLTRDWILLTINKKWRAYKSRLKNKYFNRDKRSLAEIISGVPKGVNEHQWDTLVGFWCQDSHMKLCEKNSECAKKQKNPHTTGRKSHARLRKEMEIKRNRKVSKIELWDEAHKQKDGKYKNAKTKIVMEKLEDRKKDNNGKLSFSDYREVFKSVHGEEAKKLRGYYGDKYWSEIKVSQGLTFVEHSEKEGNGQFALRALGDNVENLTDEMAMVRSFLKRKFPGEDLRNEFVTAGSDEDDLNERVLGSDLPNKSHTEVEESRTNMNAPSSAMQKAHIEKFDRAKQGSAKSTLTNEQITTQELHPTFSMRTKEDYIGLSLPQMVANKKARIYPSNCARTKEGCTSLSSPAELTVTKKTQDGPESKNGHAENSNATKQGGPKPSVQLHHITNQKAQADLESKNGHAENINAINQRDLEPSVQLHRVTKQKAQDGLESKNGHAEIINATKQHIPEPSVQLHRITKQKTQVGPEAKNGHAENINATNQGVPKPNLQLHHATKQDKVQVLLFSLNPRSKNKCLAEGILVSRDKTYVVGGNMLGEQYVAVSVSAVSRLGDERLVRPYEKFQTVRDAIGHVIAWPLSHVKKPIITTPTQPQNKPPTIG